MTITAQLVILAIGLALLFTLAFARRRSRRLSQRTCDHCGRPYIYVTFGDERIPMCPTREEEA